MNWLTQLAGYGAWWLVFLVTCYGVARYSFKWCIPCGYLAVASLIFYLDIRGIRLEMNRPDWNGVPSVDGAFAIGVVIHVLLVGTLLLPVTALGVRQKRRHRAGIAPA
jgi:hypothetical protein